MNELLLLILIINTIVTTISMRRVTSYNIIHCIFIGVLTSVPLIGIVISKVVSFVASMIMELALLLGGSSSKEIMNEFIKKYVGQKDTKE